MVAFGFGEILGGPVLGFIIDKKGNRAATLANLIMIFTETVLVLLFLYFNEYTWLAFAMAFMWGFQDSANNTHTSEMLGYEFDDNARPYAIDNFVESIGCFIFEIFESFVGTRRQYMIYNLIVGMLGLLLNSMTLFVNFREHNSDQQSPAKISLQVD